MVHAAEHFSKTNRESCRRPDDLAVEASIIPYGQQVTAAATTVHRMNNLTRFSRSVTAADFESQRSLLNDCPQLARLDSSIF